LPAKSLWVDELFTVQVAQEGDLGSLISRCIETERRPPLHYLVMHVWQGLLGDSETATRLPSVFFALLSLPLLARLARSLGSGRLGLWPAAVLAAMPTFVLYSRMARAYSMALALGLLSTILFLEVVQRPSRRAWIVYLLASAALLYTDYAVLSLILAQNLYVAYLILRRPVSTVPRLAMWLASQVALLLAFAPWLIILVSQTQRARLEADFARGLLGYALKLAYPALSLSAGETIFPWHLAALAGMMLVGILFVAGIVSLIRKGGGRAVFALLFLFTPFLFTAILLSSVASDITFINMASRTLFALPFFALIIAAGLVALPPRPWRALAVIVLLLAWGAALLNYYAGRDFHNPIYVVPMREMVQEINAAALAGDVIVYDDDSVFAYYYTRSAASTPAFSSFSESEGAQRAITSAASRRVWLVTLGRDRTRVDAPGDLFVDWLATGYQLVQTRGYAAEDALYRQVKEKLLKRPDYEYKALIRLYERK
jgi:uncharacterized membrane protein